MMKEIESRYRRIGVQGFFVIAVFCFWSMQCPFALAWHEQLQLFLFDSHYLCQRLAVPGGVSAYVSEFLVQFYNNPFFGAALLALLYLLLQMSVWRLTIQNAKKEARQSDLLFMLTFLPSLLIWFMMEDENLMLSFLVSLLLTLAVMLLYPTGTKNRLLFSLFFIPLVYWMAGPLVLMLALFTLAKEIRCANSWIEGTGAGAVQLVYAFTCIVLSSWFKPYSLRRLLVGIFYYRIPEVLPYSIIGVAALCLLIILFMPLMNGLYRMKKQGWMVGGVALLMIASALFISREYDNKKYEIIEYDYLVRTQQWDKIISKAETQRPDLPMSVCAVNLALGMTNQMGERTFEFFQNGTEGLLPKFERDFSSTILTGEAYFQLGLVNTAQRFAFEAMESIPSYDKSGRVVKRLAETNLINGQYKVAKKYLLILKRTAFYGKWAQSRLEMIAAPELIDKHPLYGRLRKMRLQDDFLFSETELDKICGQLFAHNKENTLAMQYLLIYPLLQRNLDGFMSYFGYVNSQMRYNPTVCQEAVAFAYMKRRMEAPAGMVSNNVMQRFKQFAQTYSSAGKDSPRLDAFRNTAWYYLMKE